MKAYIFTKYESDNRNYVLEKKVIFSILPRFEIIKLSITGSYDWEECNVEFQPERLNPETQEHTCTDGKLFIHKDEMSFFDIKKGWVFLKITHCPICKKRCDSLNSMET